MRFGRNRNREPDAGPGPDRESTHFDMGGNWAKLRSKHGLSNEDMFHAFLLRFLDDQIAAGKPIRFAQDPLTDTGILRRQLDHLLHHGYLYESSTHTARPKQPGHPTTDRNDPATHGGTQ